MIKFENTGAYGFETAIRGMSENVGVRQTGIKSFETFVSVDGKTISLGTYETENIARRTVQDAKVQMFVDGVLASGDALEDVAQYKETMYFVSKRGNVYNRHGKRIKGTVDHCGYGRVLLGRVNKNVHRLVAETFIPNTEGLPCVNHKDGNKLNNSVENLEWCTHSENTRHAYENGLEKRRCGEVHHSHKLTNADVKYIRDVYKKRHKDFGAVALAGKFGVDRTTILDVIHRKTWREAV